MEVIGFFYVRAVLQDCVIWFVLFSECDLLLMEAVSSSFVLCLVSPRKTGNFVCFGFPSMFSLIILALCLQYRANTS